MGIKTSLGSLGSVFGALGGKMNDAAGQALFEVASEIFAESQRICPVDTGTLRASGTIDGPNPKLNGQWEVTIGYGGPAADYALPVHERLDLAHSAPTQAKYLEKPLLDALADMPKRYAERMEAIVGGGDYRPGDDFQGGGGT